MTPARLQAQLLNTGLHQKDNPLYQVLNQIIKSLGPTTTGTTTVVSGTTSSGGETITKTIIVPGMEGESGLDGDVGFPGARGVDGISGVVGPVFTVEDGIDGVDGFNIPVQGPQGIQGNIGPIGPPAILFIDDGLPGIPDPQMQGPQGNPGPTGAQGPMGVTIITDDLIIDDPNPFIEPMQLWQVKQTIESSVYTLTGSFADITGLSVNITPTKISNRIRIQCSITTYLGNGLSTVAFKILRGSTLVQQYDSAGFNNNSAQFGTTIYLDVIDSPASISSLTYKVQAKLSNIGSGFINEPINGGDLAFSSITVTEIPA